MDRIYLDYAATTPLNQEVLAAMLPFFQDTYGNPSSLHHYGQNALRAIENARKSIAKNIHADNYDVIFTSGGSESINLGIRGVMANAFKTPKDTLLISAVEHDAVRKTAEQLEKVYGINVEVIRVDKTGLLDLDHLEKCLNDRVAMVSVIFGNNEIGTINPIREIASLCHARGALFHTDAVQASAHLSIDMNELDVDLMSMSAHKFYGPKGMGALIIKRNIDLLSEITGGGQERYHRAGTENVPLIVGMAKAFDLQNMNCLAENSRLISLRDRFIEGILQKVPDSKITGNSEKRLPNHASFVFGGINGNDLIIACDMAGFAVSSGSACKVGNPQPSAVLLALGLEPALAYGSLRVTFGRMTTEKHVDVLLNTIPSIIEKMRHE